MRYLNANIPFVVEVDGATGKITAIFVSCEFCYTFRRIPMHTFFRIVKSHELYCGFRYFYLDDSYPELHEPIEDKPEYRFMRESYITGEKYYYKYMTTACRHANNFRRATAAKLCNTGVPDKMGFLWYRYWQLCNLYNTQIGIVEI